MHSKVIQFLQSQTGAVISTLGDDGHINSSFVYYVCNPEGEIYFVTSHSTKKYKNIKMRGELNFVTTNQKELITVQARGRVKVLKDMTESQRVYGLLMQILKGKIVNWPPPFTKMQDANLVIMKVTFDWLRWGDFSRITQAPLHEFYEQIIP